MISHALLVHAPLKAVFCGAHGVFCVWSQELLGHDNEAFPAEEDVEALSQLFITIGKQLDESPKSRGINDTYFVRLKELTMHPKLAPRLRFMVGNVIDLRANNWVPRREEVGFNISNYLRSYLSLCLPFLLSCS